MSIIKGVDKMKPSFCIANETHIPEIVKLCNQIFEEETDMKKALKIYKENEHDKNQIYLIGIIDNEIMLEVIERICKERGCTSLKLWSNNYRTAAHACYKNFGFIINDAGFFSKEI